MAKDDAGGFGALLCRARWSPRMPAGTAPGPLSPLLRRGELDSNGQFSTRWHSTRRLTVTEAASG